MKIIGVNPRRNPLLDTSRRSVLELRGIPTPLPPMLAKVGGQKSPGEFIRDLTRRLAEPRANRAAIIEEMMPKLKERNTRFFGTSQQHFMLQFEEALFVTFVPDLMTPDESASFLTHWRIRGLFPAKIEACNVDRFWSYRLIDKPKFS